MKLFGTLISTLSFVSASTFGITRRLFINTHTMAPFAPTILAYSKKPLTPLTISVNGDGETNDDTTFLSAVDNNISLYGKISEKSCFQLGMLLRKAEGELLGKLEEENSTTTTSNPRINLHLQSYGGSLMPAFYICDLIKSMSFPVDTYVDGYAASAASIISVCGEKRYMTRNSMMMIHQLSGGVSGKFYEMQDDLQNSQTMMDLLGNIYLKHTNITKEMLGAYLQKDIWWNSTTCLELGLVDYIV